MSKTLGEKSKEKGGKISGDVCGERIQYPLRE